MIQDVILDMLHLRREKSLFQVYQECGSNRRDSKRLNALRAEMVTREWAFQPWD